jgi:uncharacterized repeat protein (TIGR03803 family)
MSRNASLGTLSSILRCVTVAFLAFAPGAWAAPKYKTLHRFTGGADGGDSWAGLILDQSGNLYGTTTIGGSGGYGTVFELTPNQDGSWTESVLCSFTNGADGGYPYAGLIFDEAGNLYGTTAEGGSSGGGTVFKLTPNADRSWTESVLHSFCSLTN